VNIDYEKKYCFYNVVMFYTLLEYTASHVFWEKNEKRKFEAANNILSVTTKDDIIYKFDFTTGNIIDKEIIELSNKTFKFIIIIIGAITFFILISILIIFKCKAKF